MCPKCEENTLCKIRFNNNQKLAYLCVNCNNFWFGDEHIDISTGHLLERSGDDMHSDEPFVFVEEDDKERQAVADHKKRVKYGIF